MLSVGLLISLSLLFFLIFQKERFRDYGGGRRLSEDSELISLRRGDLIGRSCPSVLDFVIFQKERFREFRAMSAGDAFLRIQN